MVRISSTAGLLAVCSALLGFGCTAQTGDMPAEETEEVWDDTFWAGEDAKADGLRRTGSVTREADNVGWSGYYWSMLRGELVMGWDDHHGRQVWNEADVRAFDGCISDYSSRCVTLLNRMAANHGEALSPMMKFDYYTRLYLEQQNGPGGSASTAYSHAAKWELENHFIGDNENHRYWDSRGYAGKCIGWALANMENPEPTADVNLLGITFHPADIKGYLASIYNGGQFFVPDDQVIGQEFHEAGDDSAAAYADVAPHDFAKALMTTIGHGRMLEADLDPGDGVWNYPIHRFEARWTRRSSTRVSVSVKIFYPNDEVDIDQVFSTNPQRPDILSRTLTFDLRVSRSWNGDLTKGTSGTWTGESVDTHPDVVIMGLEEGWRGSINDYRNTNMNTEVNFQLIKRFRINNVWSPLVDGLMHDYYAGN